MRIFGGNKNYLFGKRERERKRGGYRSKIVIFYASVHECFNLEQPLIQGPIVTLQ